jgi:hypothetical protein
LGEDKEEQKGILGRGRKSEDSAEPAKYSFPVERGDGVGGCDRVEWKGRMTCTVHRVLVLAYILCDLGVVATSLTLHS